jgi:hypothetical protein
MKEVKWMVIAAFFAGLAVASLFPRAATFAPAAHAEMLRWNPVDTEGLYITYSMDGKSITFWRFDSAGQNVRDYGPSLKWSKTYNSGQESKR